MSQADELSMRGQHQAAASAWQRVLDLRPGHAPALNHLGTQAMNRGELELAQDYFTRAIASDPKFAMPHANLSRLHSLRGDRAAAIKAIDGAITAEPTAWGPHFEKARLLEDAGRRQQAAMSWSKMLSYIPEPVANSPQAQPWVQQAREAVNANQSGLQIGRATGRESGCQQVQIQGVAGS